MEEEKIQPGDHQLEPKEEEALFIHDTADAANVAVVAAAHDVHLQEAVAGEEADRQGLDAATANDATDEALAHALHMQDLMEMTEMELRGGFFFPTALEELAGTQDPFATFSGAGAVRLRFDVPRTLQSYVPPPARGIVNETETIQRDAPPHEGGVVFLPVIKVTTPQAGTDTTPRQTFLSEVAASTDLSSSRHVLGDDVATLPSKTLLASVGSSAGCTSYTTATGLARPIFNVDDVVSSKRRTLLADADSSIIFAGMEEGDDNIWYESIMSDDEKLEHMEELGLLESLQQCVRRSEAHNLTAAVAGEEESEFSMQKYCTRWDLSPSDIEPDEPGPSTKRRTKVPPLADDEVPKFDCGICMETLDVFDLFHGLLCNHKFCTACMETYVEGRIREGDLPIPCPDPACKGEDNGILHPEKCKKAIDFAAFGDWGVRLTERAVPANRRAYCPHRQCGIMLETSGEQNPAMALCPACNHLLCATCGQEWSADDSGEHDCPKGPDAALVMKLAGERKWKRCPKCKMMVERIDGCRRMSCWCRCVFCYECGLPMSRAVAEEVGGEACRCNDAGLAFVFAHQHQIHFLDADMPQHQQQDDPPLDADEPYGLHAFDLNDEHQGEEDGF